MNTNFTNKNEQMNNPSSQAKKTYEETNKDDFYDDQMIQMQRTGRDITSLLTPEQRQILQQMNNQDAENFMANFDLRQLMQEQPIQQSFIGSHQGSGQSGHLQRICLISRDKKLVVVPFEITQMCSRIRMLLQPFPPSGIPLLSQTNNTDGAQNLFVLTESYEEHLQIVAKYCELKHYVKTTNCISYPLRNNKLKENLNTSNMLEYELLKNHLERFDYLRFLMKTTKFLGCEALYQFVAASIASWFRRRSIRDVAHDLQIEQKFLKYNPRDCSQDPLLLTVDEIKLAKNKFGHFIGPIDYFGLNSRTQSGIYGQVGNLQTNYQDPRIFQQQQFQQHQQMQQKYSLINTIQENIGMLNVLNQDQVQFNQQDLLRLQQNIEENEYDQDDKKNHENVKLGLATKGVDTQNKDPEPIIYMEDEEIIRKI